MSNSIKDYDERILKIIKQDKISLYSVIDKLNILSHNKP
jgi:predicted DNA-binding ArsR family transcriptional regulator